MEISIERDIEDRTNKAVENIIKLGHLLSSAIVMPPMLENQSKQLM